MSSEVLSVLQDVGGKANDMTHSLKEYGNGSMLEGIKGMCRDSYSVGKGHGLKEGIFFGMIGTVVVGTVCVGVKWAYNKAKAASKKSENVPEFVKNLTEKELSYVREDKDFPWEKVKKHIKENYGISEISYDTWIAPLKCIAYKDRISVEIPSNSNIDAAYIKNKYRRAIKNSVFEVTGKWYIVTIVRQGEFIIEDDDDETMNVI